MFANWMQRINTPIWNVVGPKWYSSSWWPNEPLAAKQYALLRMLAVAHAERLEVKGLVMALADEQRGQYRRRLRTLARRLNANASLVDALEKTPEVLSDHTVLALRLGAQSGTLGSTYDQLLQRESPDRASSVASHSRGYGIVLACVIAFIIAMMMFFIVPTFKKLSDELSISRPPLPFLWLCSSVDFMLHHFFWILIGLFACWWVFFYSPLRRIVRRKIFPNLLGSNSISLSARLFEMLAVITDAGRPLPGALSTLAKYHFDRTTRQRLLIARNEVEQGVPAWYSLVDAKIISKEEYQAINSAASTQVQAWTLRKMATSKQQRVVEIRQTWSAFMHPVCVLFFAAIVLWICYSFFGVIINMIQSLA